MSKFPLLNGVTVVILVTFGEMCLDFSVCNISKNYTWYIDTWTELGVGRASFFPARAEPSQKALLKKPARAEPKYTFKNISSSQVEPEKYWLKPSRAKEFFNNFYMGKIEHEIF